jgi:hypothetical protein
VNVRVFVRDDERSFELAHVLGPFLTGLFKVIARAKSHGMDVRHGSRETRRRSG